MAHIEERVRRGKAGQAGWRAGLLGFVGRWVGVGRPGENRPRLGMGVMLEGVFGSGVTLIQIGWSVGRLGGG